MTAQATETIVDLFGHVMTVAAEPHPTDKESFDESPRGRRKASTDSDVREWASLETGAQVVLWRKKNFVAAGTVDEVMPDGSALWVFLPREFRRMPVHFSDGLSIRRAGI